MECPYKRAAAVVLAWLALLLSSSVALGSAQNDANKKSQTQTAPVGAAKRSRRSPRKPQLRAWKLLRAGVTSSKPSCRQNAIAALGTVGDDPAVVKLIVGGLDDKEASVRQIAAASLGDIKAKAAIPRLQQALDDEAPEVRFAVATALWKMDDRSGRNVFVDVLDGELGAGSMQQQVQDARKKLRNPTALAMIGAKEGASALLGPFAIGLTLAREMRKDGSAPARALAASLLSSDSDPHSVNELVLALTDRSPLVRSAAAKALGNFPRRDLLPKLEFSLEDSNDAVRSMAAASIVRISRATDPR